MKRTALLTLLFITAFGVAAAKKAKLPTRSEVLNAMELANDHFTKKYPDAGAPTFVKRSRPSNLWTRGVYFEGLVALTDIERATTMEPEEPLFFAELAATNYRFNQLEEAIAAARRAIELDNAFPDAHRILGLCLRAQKKEKEAQAALQRAADLGDATAKELLGK